MTTHLTLIQGGLKTNETLVSKLLNRPEDFPEAIFQRVLKAYESRLSFLQMVTILKIRAKAAEARQAQDRSAAKEGLPAA
jgi:hypothetical protein